MVAAKAGTEAFTFSAGTSRPMMTAGAATRIGLLAELADAMDSKSIARKGVSVRLR